MLSSVCHIRARRALIAGMALLAAACDSTRPERPAAEVAGRVISPNGAEGAAVIELTGAEVVAVTADAGELFRETRGTVTRVVLVLDAPGELLFTVAVRDPDALPAGTVVEVSGPDDALRASLAGYRVELTP